MPPINARESIELHYNQLRNGDHEGSEAPTGVGKRRTIRPVTSTDQRLGKALPRGVRKK